MEKQERLVIEPAMVSLCMFSARILTPICSRKSRLSCLGAEGHCTEAYVHKTAPTLPPPLCFLLSGGIPRSQGYGPTSVSKPAP